MLKEEIAMPKEVRQEVDYFLGRNPKTFIKNITLITS